MTIFTKEEVKQFCDKVFKAGYEQDDVDYLFESLENDAAGCLDKMRPDLARVQGGEGHIVMAGGDAGITYENGSFWHVSAYRDPPIQLTEREALLDYAYCYLDAECPCGFEEGPFEYAGEEQ